MKKLLALILALLLSGCAAISPVTPTSVPPTPIIATVLVTVIPTQEPTQVPTETPAPTQTPQVIVVTATPAEAASPTPASNSSPANSGAATATATLPSNAGGLTKGGEVLFTNLTRSGSYFNLRCSPQDITFSASTSNGAVVEVDMYYRMEDLTTQPVSISDWKNLGKMTSDGHGNYTMDVNTLQNLSPDLRASARAWFDYQFVAIAKDGNSVGNSGIIAKQVLYLKDCP
jgi:PBP1b-binding outer membrane lipoprotein LpoB